MADDLADLNDLLRRAFRYALSLTHDRAGAEELVQDACLGVSRAGGPWRIEYLIAAIRNRHCDLCRRRRTLEFHPLEQDVAAAPFTSDGDPELESALASLRAEERELLYLAAVEEYSASRIAEMTGRPRGTVLSAIHRAKQKLRGLLTDVPMRKIS